MNVRQDQVSQLVRILQWLPAALRIRSKLQPLSVCPGLPPASSLVSPFSPLLPIIQDQPGLLVARIYPTIHCSLCPECFSPHPSHSLSLGPSITSFKGLSLTTLANISTPMRLYYSPLLGFSIYCF